MPIIGIAIGLVAGYVVGNTKLAPVINKKVKNAYEIASEHAKKLMKKNY